MNAKLNRRERKAAELLEHYARCEALARHLGALPESKIDGKRISSQLFRVEREAHQAMEHICSYPEPFFSPLFKREWDFNGADENLVDEFKAIIAERVAATLGKLPPAFFVNGDPRGYALKIDNDKPEGKALIEAVKLHTDWGGYGILSPEITGD